jgi:hypothetical protein
MSRSPALMRSQACRGRRSARRRGAVAEKKFVPAGVGSNIPLFPHIPRNRRPDPAGLGKEGKSSAASAQSEAICVWCWSASESGPTHEKPEAERYAGLGNYGSLVALKGTTVSKPKRVLAEWARLLERSHASPLASECRRHERG